MVFALSHRNDRVDPRDQGTATVQSRPLLGLLLLTALALPACTASRSDLKVVVRDLVRKI